MVLPRMSTVNGPVTKLLVGQSLDEVERPERGLDQHPLA